MKKLLLCFTISSILLLQNFAFSQNSLEVVKKIEAMDYYSYISLVLNLHNEIGRGESNEASMFFVMSLLKEVKHYADLDIIKYIGHSLDVGRTLDYLLSDIGMVLSHSINAISQIQANLFSLESKKNACDLLKETSDKTFSMALKDQDVNIMEKSLIQSIEYQNCSSESRINYNAQLKILDLFRYYHDILQHKYSYFYGNQFDIIKNYQNIIYAR